MDEPIMGISESHYEAALASVHRLAGAGKLARALTELVDERTWRLRNPFRSDGNHSWYIAGDLLLKQERYSEAAKAFRRSLRAWQDDSHAMSAIGYCYSEIGKAWLAEYYFRRALRIDPTNQEVRFNLGNALYDQRKFDDAIAEYAKVTSRKGKLSQMARRNSRLARSGYWQTSGQKGVPDSRLASSEQRTRGGVSRRLGIAPSPDCSS